MQVKVISDTHKFHDQLTDLECDILVHCGDFCTKGNYTEIRTFLEWFVKQNAKYKVLVIGNHESKFKAHTELLSLAREYGIHVLRNEKLVINGKVFWGGDFVPWVRDGQYQSSLEVRVKAWKDMPDDLDLLITHAPPRLILDVNPSGHHIGCDQLLEAVKVRNIKNHVFGHLHGDGGKSLDLFGTKFYNCACLDESYLMVRNYTEIKL